MTEAESSEKRQKEFVERSKMFQNELDVDETLAQLLVAEGFSELEEVAYVETREELAADRRLDEELAEELQSRATEALERREEAARTNAVNWASKMRSPNAAPDRSDAGHAGQGRDQDA
jgi:N utilization substance protein A